MRVIVNVAIVILFLLGPSLEKAAGEIAQVLSAVSSMGSSAIGMVS